MVSQSAHSKLMQDWGGALRFGVDIRGSPQTEASGFRLQASGFGPGKDVHQVLESADQFAVPTFQHVALRCGHEFQGSLPMLVFS